MSNVMPQAQTTAMEFDHIFICVPFGAFEAEALNEFGLTEGSPNHHPGQGTANRRFFFRNAFIELLYLVDSHEAQNEITRPTMLFERLSAQGSGTSPFGVCFRPTNRGEKEATFPSWSYKPSYLPNNLQVAIAEPSPLSEPMWFFLSFGSRPDLVAKERQQPLSHQIGFVEVTSIRVSFPQPAKLSVAAICAAKNISAIESDSHLFEVGFDHEVNGRSHDFRPTLPLVFKW